MSRIITQPREAAIRLHEGALVAIPTETVYGLAADAYNEVAVRRVFAVKGRPLGHPLIVHLDQPHDAHLWSTHIDQRLLDLTSEYWPGPLTVIVPKAAWVPDVITGGQPTVALRVPDHPLARAVLAELSALQGRPAAVVAPSANRFGQVSPTSAEHVVVGLGQRWGADDSVLDGGQCRIGVESTVVAVVGDELRVLRPGVVELPGAAGPNDSTALGEQQDAPRAPGTLAAHYAPEAAVMLAEIEGIDDTLAQMTHSGGDVTSGIIAPASVATPEGWVRLAAPDDAQQYAHSLYSALRRADAEKLHLVLAVLPPPGGIADAVRDRLFRAAAGSQRW